MSDSTLQQPQANRRLRNTSHTDKALLNIGLAEGDPITSEGFTMHGLSKDNWEAWNARSFHKSKNIDPFVKRIQNVTLGVMKWELLTHSRASLGPHGTNLLDMGNPATAQSSETIELMRPQGSNGWVDALPLDAWA